MKTFFENVAKISTLIRISLAKDKRKVFRSPSPLATEYSEARTHRMNEARRSSEYIERRTRYVEH